MIRYMPITEITLRPGQKESDGNAVFLALRVTLVDDSTPEVTLSIFYPGDKYISEITVRPGETFPVDWGQTWQLTLVETPDGPDWKIHLARLK